MRRGTRTALGVVGVCVLLAVSATAAQQQLGHVGVIDLGPYFNSTTEYGDNPLSITFDGTHAFVGGYTNAAGNIGVVKVENVVTAPTPVELADSIFEARAYTGINSVDTGNDELYIGYNSFGGAGDGYPSFVRKADYAGATQWTYFTPSDQRVSAMAWDALGKGSGAALAYVTRGSGYVRYVGPDGVSQGNGTITTIAGGTTFRGMDIDSDGNIATNLADRVGYGLRTSPTALKHLDGVTAGPEEVITKFPGYEGYGLNIAMMEDMYPDGPYSDLLALTARGTSVFTDSQDGETVVDDKYVHIRNLDGTPGGLSQIVLTGAEGGLAGEWTGNIKDLAFGLDAAGTPTLLVLDFVGRRLDVYQVPEPAALTLLALGAVALVRRR